jgi:NADH dehydrogenase (ubiquinone) flavoprotein 2
MLARLALRRCSAKRASFRGLSNYHPLASHVDTPDNTVETYFDFTKANYDTVERILAKYPTNYRQSGVIPLLVRERGRSGGSS